MGKDPDAQGSGSEKGIYLKGAGRNQSQYKARGHKQQSGQGTGKVARTRAWGKTRLLK